MIRFGDVDNNKAFVVVRCGKPDIEAVRQEITRYCGEEETRCDKKEIAFELRRGKDYGYSLNNLAAHLRRIAPVTVRTVYIEEGKRRYCCAAD